MSNADNSEPNRNYRPSPISSVGWKAGEQSGDELLQPGTPSPPAPAKSAFLAIIVGGLITLVLATVAFTFFLWADDSGTPEVEQPISSILSERELSDLSRQSVIHFFEAGTIEGRLPYVCEPERVEPLMRDHYNRFPIDVREVTKVDLMTSVTRYKTKHPHALGTVIDTDGKVSLAILREYPDKALIDWEALVAYNPMPLAGIIASQPEEPQQIRVMLRRSDYYNFGYEDESIWQSFVMVNSNEDGVSLAGYAKRGSELLHELMSLTRGGHSAALRLEVQCTARPGQNVVTILRIAAPHWLGGDA